MFTFYVFGLISVSFLFVILAYRRSEKCQWYLRAQFQISGCLIALYGTLGKSIEGVSNSNLIIFGALLAALVFLPWDSLLARFVRRNTTSDTEAPWSRFDKYLMGLGFTLLCVVTVITFGVVSVNIFMNGEIPSILTLHSGFIIAGLGLFLFICLLRWHYIPANKKMWGALPASLALLGEFISSIVLCAIIAFA